MQTILLVTEGENWLIERAKKIVGNVPGIYQLTCYIPNNLDIRALLLDLEKNRRSDELKLEIFTVSDPSDIEILVGKIDENVVFYFLCDGFAPYLGTPLSELFRSLGASVFGSATTASNLAQDKYSQFLMFKELGIKTPRTWLPEKLDKSDIDSGPYIVKPRNLGNSIGIFDDAYGCRLRDALSISKRIQQLYGLPSIVQEYVKGTYARASIIGVHGRSPTADSLGVYVMETNPIPSDKYTDFKGYFSTYKDQNSTYNSRVRCTELSEYSFEGLYNRFQVLDEVTECLRALISNLPLQDFFTIDLIINQNGVFVLEVNTNPFPRNRSLDLYCEDKFGMNKHEALRASLARVL